MPFDIQYSDKQRKSQREISDRLDELSRCYARHIVYIATTMDGKDRNFEQRFYQQDNKMALNLRGFTKRFR